MNVTKKELLEKILDQDGFVIMYKEGNIAYPVRVTEGVLITLGVLLKSNQAEILKFKEASFKR